MYGCQTTNTFGNFYVGQHKEHPMRTILSKPKLSNLCRCYRKKKKCILTSGGGRNRISKTVLVKENKEKVYIIILDLNYCK